MEVILLQKVQNLGNLGDKVSVRPGHARNFLVPQGMATRATKQNIEAFEQRRAELQKRADELFKQAQAKETAIMELKISIPAKAGDEGKLFGSIGTVDIAQAISQAGVAIEKKDVRLPNGPLRTIGEHVVAIHLHTDITMDVTLDVVAE